MDLLVSYAPIQKQRDVLLELLGALTVSNVEIVVVLLNSVPFDSVSNDFHSLSENVNKHDDIQILATLLHRVAKTRSVLKNLKLHPQVLELLRVYVELSDDASDDICDIAVKALELRPLSDKFLLTSCVRECLCRRLSVSQLWAHVSNLNTSDLYILSSLIESDAFKHHELCRDFYLSMANILVTGSSERRKLSVYILSKVVNSLRHDVNYDIFRYSVTHDELTWSKFFTLVDMISLDTSVHQTKAALPDLNELLRTMPSLWTTCLLKLGLGSPLPGIRVEVAKFMFGVPELLELDLVIDSFLPFVSQPSFFTRSVEARAGQKFSSKQTTNDNNGDKSSLRTTCPHGMEISHFIRSVDFTTQHLNKLIKSLYTGKKSFEASIVYVLRGIYMKNITVSESTVTEMNNLIKSSFESEKLRKCVMLYCENINRVEIPQATHDADSISESLGSIGISNSDNHNKGSIDHYLTHFDFYSTNPHETRDKIREFERFIPMFRSCQDNRLVNSIKQVLSHAHTSTLLPVYIEYLTRVRCFDIDLALEFYSYAEPATLPSLIPYLFSFHDERLRDIAYEIVQMSYARKGILPVLARCLDLNEMYIPVLIEIYTFEQTKANFFTIEDVAVSQVNLDLHSQIPLSAEYLARAYVANTISKANHEQAQIVFESIKSRLFKESTASDEAHRVLLSHLLVLIEPYLDLSVLDDVSSTLRIEFSPAVRVSLEWVMARMLLRGGDVEKYIFTPLEYSNDTPRYLSSILTSCVCLTRYIPQLVNRITPVLIAFATTNRAVLRHTAASLLLGINVSQDMKEVTEVLRMHVLSSPQKFKYGEEVLWDILDTKLELVCGGVINRVCEMKYYQLVNEHIESAYSVDDGSKTESVDDANAVAWEDLTNISLQTKSNTRFPTPRPVRTTSGRLIVIASLVDKPPNLGGICRLCDVLGAELLCVADLAVVHTREFQAVAVTADKWMPMRQVGAQDMSEYLRECRSQGYAIWGLEQTDSSVLLSNELQFPQKMVLVLGKEKEGIPASVLRELDRAVEIKQVGVVRSMNVQTATAVVVHAYAAQHC